MFKNVFYLIKVKTKNFIFGLFLTSHENQELVELGSAHGLLSTLFDPDLKILQNLCSSLL